MRSKTCTTALLWLALMALNGCEVEVEIPLFDSGGLLGSAAPVSGPLDLLEGRYRLTGHGELGEVVSGDASLVVRGETVSVFTEHNVYLRIQVGCLVDERQVLLEGYWREADTVEIGLVRLFISAAEVYGILCEGEAVPSGFEPSAIQAEGWFGEATAQEGEGLSLVWIGETKPHQDFFIVAHRGGCRTSDHCGASENSVEVIRMAESFGADAIEVDAVVTRDGVPMLYHDEAFSARLVDGTYCLGEVGEWTQAHVRALCRLKKGEQIPTLEEALRAVIDETGLGGVWIDVKNPASLVPVIEVVERTKVYAASINRPIVLLYGLYSEEMIDAYRRAPVPDGSSCLVELEPKDALSLGCQVWAPRWTRGPMTSKVLGAQDQGLLVGFWTLDARETIDLVLEKARPNAILTNRPWLVYQRYQSVGVAATGPDPFPVF